MTEELQQAPAEIPALPEQDGSVESAHDILAGMLNSGRLKSIKDDDDEVVDATPSVLTAPEPEPESTETGDGVQAPATTTATPEPTPPATAPAPVAAQAAPQPMPVLDDKAREAETAARNHASTAYAQVLQAQARVQGQFSDIRSMDDLRNLARTDVGRYNEFVLAQTELQQAQQAFAGARAKIDEVNRANFEAWQQSELKKLPDLIPDLKDPEKAKDLPNRILQFAKANGVSDEQLLNMPAHGFKILHLAMSAQDMAAAKDAQAKEMAELKKTAQAKAAKAPPVQEPGTRTPDNRANQIQSDFKRLQNSGRVEDAANIFKQMLN